MRRGHDEHGGGHDEHFDGDGDRRGEELRGGCGRQPGPSSGRGDGTQSCPGSAAAARVSSGGNGRDAGGMRPGCGGSNLGARGAGDPIADQFRRLRGGAPGAGDWSRPAAPEAGANPVVAGGGGGDGNGNEVDGGRVAAELATGSFRRRGSRGGGGEDAKSGGTGGEFAAAVKRRAGD